MAFNKILVATDFSPSAQMAAERAAILAKQYGAQIDLFHVISRSLLDKVRLTLHQNSPGLEDRLVKECQENLDQLSAFLSTHYEIEIGKQLHEGNVIEALLQSVKSSNYDLVVLGARGENQLRDALLGSTVERFMGKANIPVLVVRKYSKMPYRHALVPVDFSLYSIPAFRLARTLIMDEGEITLLHALELPFENRLRHAGVSDDAFNIYMHEAMHEAQMQIEILAADGEGWGTVDREVIHGPIAKTIVEQAELEGVDLIVIGRHSRSPIEELLLGTIGSVTSNILFETSCDVLVSPESIK